MTSPSVYTGNKKRINYAVASAISLGGCNLKRMNANQLVPSLADILAGVRAEVFRPGGDFEASLTGNGSVDILASASQPQASVPMFLIKTGLGRDKQATDMLITIAGHRVGTPQGLTDPITARVTATPVPGVPAVFLLMFAEAIQAGQFFPCAFQLTYHASAPVKATMAVTGAQSDTITKVYAVTNGSTYMDNVTRVLEAQLDSDPTNDAWDNT